jgi:hypothetical protein
MQPVSRKASGMMTVVVKNQERGLGVIVVFVIEYPANSLTLIQAAAGVKPY